uniref:tRNA nucleotidyltransferase/poly(A) polymerase RNA and SrmB- binding domain-containing protein n=1 Tax=Cyclophora tenuis TaxID=216820 RepID=A0A7S1D858_CYCTE|mmetsp:Transcript_3765/g.6435  ORF Transcript_3765/g.6435 Transcript_3765/m.6435 type:complete len:375 (+) Transcript_3765:1-1125(+)
MTRRIEDWSGRGLRDLLDHPQIVTPLDPFVTLHDDPLRVLRAIRFAVRLGYPMDSALERACRSPRIQERLRIKVSRERVGKELEGMFKGKNANPRQALLTIGRLDLSSSVFLMPNESTVVEDEDGGSIEIRHHQSGQEQTSDVEQGWKASQRVLQLMDAPCLQSSTTTTTTTSSSSQFDLRLWVLAVYLLPFRKVTYVDRKNKTHLVAEYMIRESIKFKNKDVVAINSIMESVDGFARLLLENSNVGSLSRLEAGLLLRSTRELWVTALWVAVVLQKWRQGNEQQQQQQRDWSAAGKAMQEQIQVSLQLDHCWKMRPMLDGRALIQALNLPKGPIVGLFMEEQIKWMLLHPDGTKEDCQDHLEQFQKQQAQQEQ